ncbi:hypothetical protein WJX84_011974 [Apatococcus fuscideae]|uniref:Uncharacterized protein n=1 Tax=Apatococcus fuscideae TaxID=2026836 RepID=A0AAW1TC77_9CHLO
MTSSSGRSYYSMRSLSDLNIENLSIWKAKASHWDREQGDSGNTFQATLVYPAAERMLLVAEHTSACLQGKTPEVHLCFPSLSGLSLRPLWPSTAAVGPATSHLSLFWCTWMLGPASPHFWANRWTLGQGLAKQPVPLGW